MMSVIRMSGGIVRRLPARKAGALAQCTFCPWGRFFEEKKSDRRKAIFRAAASLQYHIVHEHQEAVLKTITAEEFLLHTELQTGILAAQAEEKRPHHA